jgi:NTP pyrophosphatase (non-canonical NTP hydrolase)
MNLNQYQELARRTAKVYPTLNENLVHAALGITSEAGELATTVKATAIYSKPLDTTNVIEEVGDSLWYLALMCTSLGVPLEEVATANIAKLKARYPDKYSDGDALARADKVAL